jgi:hypothetical protein
MMRKALVRLLAVSILLTAVLMPLTMAAYADTLPTLYEYYNTDGDGDSPAIYGASWVAMQFTVGSISHTAVNINLYLKRYGTSPGTVTISLRHADDDYYPVGLDIVSTTLNGDDFTTAYSPQQFTVLESSLEENSKYAILVRAVAGDSDNYILWQKDTDGGLADAVGCHSENGGSNWSTDDPTDYLFEIWGNPCMRVKGAAVFQNYLEDGDLLFTVEYVNVYPPYYPDSLAKQYFDIQLLGTNGTTVLASTACLDWGNKPGSIYLSADSAAPLTLGSAYYIRLYGVFSGNPSVSYQLQGSDWYGSDLTILDTWILSTAHSIATYYSTEMTTRLAPKGEVLNAEGGTIFMTGIPLIDQVRPDLFQIVMHTLAYPGITGEVTFSTAKTWEDMVGPGVANVLNICGGVFGMGGKDFGAFLLLGVYLAIAIMGVFLVDKIGKVGVMGDMSVGIGLAIPFVLLGAWLRLIDIVIIAVVSSVVVLFFIGYSIWLSRT